MRSRVRTIKFTIDWSVLSKNDTQTQASRGNLSTLKRSLRSEQNLCSVVCDRKGNTQNYRNSEPTTYRPIYKVASRRSLRDKLARSMSIEVSRHVISLLLHVCTHLVKSRG